MNIDIDNLPLDDQPTWDLISSGETIGCFQIESRLGRQTCKQVKPQNIKELADVVALIRPSCIGGDTKIAVDYKKNGSGNLYKFNIKMKDLYKNQDRYSHILSLDETTGRIIKNKLIKVIYQGTKKIYEPKFYLTQRQTQLATRETNLQCTADHRLLTSSGWKQLKNIEIGDRVAICQRKRGSAQYEKHPPHEDIVWSSLSEIKECGEDDVYDIIMDGPHHNFIAGKVIVHNCLEAKLEDGNNFVWHYTERKFGRERPQVLHEALRDILEPTQGLLLYQEQSIKIGSEIGGMDLAQADQLIRKGLGKKLPEVVAKAKKVFLEGNKRLKKVSDEDALTIFEYLEKGQRYQFNLSHSISYAHLSYVTAYLKTHYPLRFYRSYLDHAKDKQKPLEEINKLVESARRANIQICNPDIRRRNSNFAIEDNKIFFGLSSIKGIGVKAVEDILQNTPADIPDDWTYVLFNILLNNKKSIVKSLIAVGALDFLEPTRDQMLYEHEQVLHLSARETKYIQDNFENLRTDDPAEVLYSLCDLGSGKNTGIANVSRLSIIKGLAHALEHPMYSLQDSIKKIASYEESYLGISLSCSKFDLLDRSQANTTCDEFNKDVKVNNILIFGQVIRINDFINKDGQEMMFFDLKDDTDEISVLVRPQMYDQVSKILKKMRLYKVGGFKKRNTLTLTYCEEIYE